MSADTSDTAAWDNLEWVNEVTDAVANAERLDDAFQTIMFRIAPPEDESDDDAPRGPRFVTKEDEQRDDDIRAEMRAELEDLQGGPEEEEPEDDIMDFDKISENEMLEQEDDGEDLDEFAAWIEQDLDAHDGVQANQREIDREMKNMMMTQADDRLAAQPIPERFAEIGIREKRPQLECRPLPDGSTFTMNRQQEAIWIVKQLTKRGNALQRCPAACEVARKPAEEAAATPIVAATTAALELMIDQKLEPAHIAIYCREKLSPLIQSLWTTGELQDSTVSSAYSATTGERLALVSRGTQHWAGFPSVAPPSALRAQFNRDAVVQGAPVVRKPCVIELARLLVNILELDCECHNIQRNWYILRGKLEALTQDPSLSGILSEDMQVFSQSDFEVPAHVSFWGRYVAHWSKLLLFDNKSSTAMSHTQRLRNMRLEGAYFEYTITSQQYQQNLINRFRFNRAPQPPMESANTWADTVATQTGLPNLTGDQVLNMLNLALAEELAALPFVNKKVFDLFCSDGLCIVKPTQRNMKQERIAVKVSRLLEVNPRQFLQYHQQRHTGLVEIEFALSERLLLDELSLPGYIEASLDLTEESSWKRERGRAVAMLLPRLVHQVKGDVEQLLLKVAESAVIRGCVETLGAMCACGPYESTKLAIYGYQESTTWETNWNSVEALPKQANASRQRICAAIRADNNVSVFTCIDEAGTLRGTVRWVDCDTKSAEGRARDQAQKDDLIALFKNCTPNVIAVAASGAVSRDLFQRVQRFVDFEATRVFKTTINVIWASPVVANAYQWSEAAQNELPNTDVFLRAALSTARFVRDPLLELCRLFDPVSRDVLRLPLGLHNLVSNDKIFSALEWEMSAWVTACGVDLNDVLMLSNPASVLQFVAGLGRRKAQGLLLKMNNNSIVSREQLAEVLDDSVVAQNALPALRLSSEAANLLDCTLIPPQLYEAAGAVARVVTHAVDSSLAVVNLMMMDLNERRTIIARGTNHSDFAKAVEDVVGVSLSMPTLDLIADELAALGRSFQRRPFRCISNEHWMKLLTGVHFLRENEGTEAMPSALVLRERDTVSGTVAGIEIGKNPGIKVRTGRDLDAIIYGDDISDERLRSALADVVVAQMAQKEERKQATMRGEMWERKERPPLPLPLRRGTPIFGTVVSVNASRCEVRLRWVPPPEPGVQSSDNKVVNWEADSQRSLRTEDIMRTARVNATKFSRHVLFKNVSKSDAVELLKDKVIGEAVVRPHERVNEGVISARVGDNDGSVMHIRFLEERRSDGSLIYSIADKRTRVRREYEEIDQCLEQYVERVSSRIRTLRAHRRFQPNLRLAESALEENQRQSPKSFAYCFVEHCSDEASQNFYRVLFRLPGEKRTNRYHLYIDCEAIHLCLPNQKVPCEDAEDCSAKLKEFVISRRSGNRNGQQ